MVNQYIIDYLQKNKDRFSFEILREKLIKAGYSISLIEEAAQLVYREAPLIEKEMVEEKVSRPPSFWDFWHKKRYRSGKERLLDLAAGFGFAIIFSIIGFGFISLIRIVGFFGYYIYYIFFLLYCLVFLGAIIYFLIKRKYIALGMICAVIIPPIIFCIFIFLL